MSSSSPPPPSKVSDLTEADLDPEDIPNLLQLISGRCRSLQSKYVTVEMLESVKSDMQNSFSKKLSLHNNRLKEMEDKCEELKLKVDNFGNEMNVYGDSLATLKSDLATFTDKFDSVSVELQERNNRFEDRSTGLLRVLSEDMEMEMTKWNLKQSLLKEELGKIKDHVKKLSPTPAILPKVKIEQVPEMSPAPTGNESISVATDNDDTIPSSTTQQQQRPATPPTPTIGQILEGDHLLGQPTPPGNFHPSFIDELIGTPSALATSSNLGNGNNPAISLKPFPKGNSEHALNPSDPSGRGCLCGKQYETSERLRRHIQYFTRERKFSCKFCPKQFRRTALLRNHLNKCHQVLLNHSLAFRGRARNPTTGSTSKPNGKKNTLKGNVSKRKPSVTGGTNAFKNGRMLIAHGEATKPKGEAYLPIVCLCGRRFHTATEFSQHLASFARFSCKQCSKGFTKKGDLGEHIKRAHKMSSLPSSPSMQPPTKVNKRPPPVIVTATTTTTPSPIHPIQSTSKGIRVSGNLSFPPELDVQPIHPKKPTDPHPQRIMSSLNKLWEKRIAQSGNNVNINKVARQPNSQNKLNLQNQFNRGRGQNQTTSSSNQASPTSSSLPPSTS